MRSDLPAKKADYSKIAAFYDKAHVMRESNVRMWINFIYEHVDFAGGARLLDLGCGTGRFSLPLAADPAIRVTGADSSSAMLERARSKDIAGLIHWELQDAESLTFPAESFNVVFMSHLLHHLDRPGQALNECERVLTTPGVILIRYGAIEQIRDDYRHTFFSETLDIDEARTPSIKMVEAWLKEAGFSSVSSAEVRQKTFKNSSEMLEATRNKLTSVLSMISEQAFREGLKKLTSYTEANPDDPLLLENRLTLSVGHKWKP